jgi:hypothetical protein
VEPTLRTQTTLRLWQIYQLVQAIERVKTPCPSGADEVTLALILQELELTFVDTLPPGGSMAILVVSLQPSQSESAEVSMMKPVCVGAIEEASRFSGWIKPLDQMCSRFQSKISTDAKTGERVELNGTALGHFNAGSATDSDITAVQMNEIFSLDLGDMHLMFDCSLMSKEHEWCVG